MTWFERLSAVALAGALVTGACGGKKKKSAAAKFEPRLTDARMPPALRGLVLGSTTPAQARNRFPKLILYKDQRLGGKSKRLEACDRPAVLLKTSEKAPQTTPRLELSFIKRGDALRLIAASVGYPKGAGLCAWVEKHMGSLPGATESSGSNRMYGKNKYGVTYAVGTSDGKQGVEVDCHHRSKAERLSLALMIGDGCGTLRSGLVPEP